MCLELIVQVQNPQKCTESMLKQFQKRLQGLSGIQKTFLYREKLRKSSLFNLSSCVLKNNLLCVHKSLFLPCKYSALEIKSVCVQEDERFLIQDIFLNRIVIGPSLTSGYLTLEKIQTEATSSLSTRGKQYFSIKIDSVNFLRLCSKLNRINSDSVGQIVDG